MAHKKGAGSSKNGRESESKRLGVKIFGGQENVGLGKDHTLFALVNGTVEFRKKKDNKSYVSVVPFEA